LHCLLSPLGKFMTSLVKKTEKVHIPRPLHICILNNLYKHLNMNS
jgi:hypothetical protein